MKAMAYVLAILILLLFIAGGSSSPHNICAAQARSVFAAGEASAATDLTVKPLCLRLMTYNIHRGIGKDGKLDLDRTAVAILGSQADIIALQEVERHSIRTDFQDQIKKLSEAAHMNYAYGKSLNLLNGEYGNGLLSKYPIREYEVYPLPSFGEQRTLLKAVIDIDGHPLAVYNTHLGLKESERKEQTDFILKLLSEESLDYVLMGDMNSKSSKLPDFTDKLQDSAQDSHKAQQSTFQEGGVQERIDYIFGSPGLKLSGYDVVKSQASDHDRVLCKIELK
jgi:endonuclease/exonuclease/phosphatase family metal-dependent hydrolase